MLEAATGFEPVIKVLQTFALPLGHAAAILCCYHGSCGKKVGACSPTCMAGAEDGIRTRDPHLGNPLMPFYGVLPSFSILCLNCNYSLFNLTVIIHVLRVFITTR